MQSNRLQNREGPYHTSDYGYCHAWECSQEARLPDRASHCCGRKMLPGFTRWQVVRHSQDLKGVAQMSVCYSRIYSFFSVSSCCLNAESRSPEPSCRMWKQVISNCLLSKTTKLVWHCAGGRRSALPCYCTMLTKPKKPLGFWQMNKAKTFSHSNSCVVRQWQLDIVDWEVHPFWDLHTLFLGLFSYVLTDFGLLRLLNKESFSSRTSEIAASSMQIYGHDFWNGRQWGGDSCTWTGSILVHMCCSDSVFLPPFNIHVQN